jgi:hypothetical protein
MKTVPIKDRQFGRRAEGFSNLDNDGFVKRKKAQDIRYLRNQIPLDSIKKDFFLSRALCQMEQAFHCSRALTL